MVHKNPFNFTIDFVPDNSKAREALTRDQQQKLLEFARTDPKSMHHYDLIVVLLGTGMRAGELCGLTFNDLDLRTVASMSDGSFCAIPTEGTTPLLHHLPVDLRKFT